LDSENYYSVTEKIIGFAMKIHRALGPGFLESVYLKALIHELRRAGFSAETDQRITVRYENVIVGDFIADLIVNETVLCELKGKLSHSYEP